MDKNLKITLCSLTIWDQAMLDRPNAKEKMQENVDAWRALFRADDFVECMDILGSVASPVYIEFFRALDEASPKPKKVKKGTDE